MATLHVRNIPDDLYARLRRRAEAASRSISAEVVTLLGDVLPPDQRRLAIRAALRRIERRRLARRPGGPSAVEMIREDRDR